MASALHHLRRFHKDQSGAVAATYALALIPLVAMAGLGFDYARMAGYSGVRLLAVEEQMGFQQPMYDVAPQAIKVTGSRISTPTRPGQVGTQVTMTVKYELTR